MTPSTRTSSPWTLTAASSTSKRPPLPSTVTPLSEVPSRSSTVVPEPSVLSRERSVPQSPTPRGTVTEPTQVPSPRQSTSPGAARSSAGWRGCSGVTGRHAPGRSTRTVRRDGAASSGALAHPSEGERQDAGGEHLGHRSHAVTSSWARPGSSRPSRGAAPSRTRCSRTGTRPALSAMNVDVRRACPARGRALMLYESMREAVRRVLRLLEVGEVHVHRVALLHPHDVGGEVAADRGHVDVAPRCPCARCAPCRPRPRTGSFSLGDRVDAHRRVDVRAA